jgi:hypothetical protein
MSKNQDLGELINGIKSLGTNQLNAPAYTSATSFTGTLAGLLGFDSSGNIITTSAAGGGVTSFNTRTGAVTLSSSDVTGALGFTPYNATNPSGFISGINSGMVTSALGYTPVPPSRTLTINGTTFDLSADRSWTVSGSSQWTTSGSNIYFTGGFVGINTTSPQYILDVSGGARFTAWSSMGINARFAWNMISDQYLGNGFAGAIRIDNADGRFSFYTAPSGVAGAFPVQTERFTITNAGNVGIGTTTPAVPLEISNSNPAMAIFNSSNANGGYTIFRRNGTDYGYIGNAYHLVTPVGANTDIAIAGLTNIIFSSGSSLIERMRITNDGRVGIGTTGVSSLFLLQVLGGFGSQVTGGGADGGYINVYRSGSIVNTYLGGGDVAIRNTGTNQSIVLNSTGIAMFSLPSSSVGTGYLWRDGSGYLRVG